MRLGVDIGGTFTDIIVLGRDGTVHARKVLSTPDDYSRAIEDGVTRLLADARIAPAEISEFAHGTTVATNALIERRGGKVALVTTRGFRDVPELARFRSPRLYDLGFRKPEPLVERRFRFEVIEAENPLLVERYGFLPDTGGPGEHRGALGVVRQYRALADDTLIQVRSDRQRFRPWGLFGGKERSPGRCILNPGASAGAGAEELPSKFIRTLPAGAVFRSEMPGSGGYGDPLEREPARVLEDVRQEKMTREHALAEYGVVIDGKHPRVDRAATGAQRASRRRNR